MAQTLVDYRRLPGRSTGSFGTHQRLYAGPDHVLVAKTAFLNENYKRFYYNDIQALTLQKTSQGAVLNVGIGAIFSMMVLITLGVVFSGGVSIFDPVSIFAIIITVLMLVLLLWNLALGPTCECFLLTAVHAERLECLTRIRTAQKTFNLLRPIIETVQGVIQEEQAADAVAGASPEKFSALPPAARNAMLEPRLGKRDSGNVHMALFAYLFLDCALSLSNIIFQGWMPSVLSLLLLLILLVLIVAALVRQHRSDMPPPLRNIVWGLFVYGCFLGGIAYFLQILLQMEMQTGMQEESAGFAQFRQVLTLSSNIVSVVCDLGFGAAGLTFLRGYLREYQAPEATPSEG